jgi:hypothetical protein
MLNWSGVLDGRHGNCAGRPQICHRRKSANGHEKVELGQDGPALRDDAVNTADSQSVDAGAADPTAVAPSANAFATSVPERMPESNRTGMPSTASTTPAARDALQNQRQRRERARPFEVIPLQRVAKDCGPLLDCCSHVLLGRHGQTLEKEPVGALSSPQPPAT